MSVYSVAAAAAAAQSLSGSVSLSRDQRVIGPAPRPPRPIGRAALTTFTPLSPAAAAAGCQHECDYSNVVSPRLIPDTDSFLKLETSFSKDE